MIRNIRYFVLIILTIASHQAISQQEGNIWMLGANGSNPCCKLGFDFNGSQMDTFSLTRNMNFFVTNSSICDSSGSLLFYTNGYQIANKHHDSLPGSAGFNPSLTNPSQLNLNIDQATLILPVPRSDSLYYIFHVNGESALNDAAPLELRMTLVNMKLDSGNGAIEPNTLNTVIYSDTLVLGRLTATKHANGHDWWLVSHSWWSNEYLVFLVTSDSIYAPKKQKIGPYITSDTGGKAVFSPNGRQFANIGWDFAVDILDFDRCFGYFSNARTITIADTNFSAPDTLILVDCAFSPNNKFLYLHNFYNLYQIELGNDSASSTICLIDTWDGTSDPSATFFNDMMLGPDGKIYVSTWNGTYRSHVIHNPNLADTLCNFEQNLVMPQANVRGLPNLVNYTLDSLPKTYCDSIFNPVPTAHSSSNINILVFPIPATTYVSVIMDNPNSELNSDLILYDSRGIYQRTYSSSNSNYIIKRRHLKAGMYFYRMYFNNGTIRNGKIIFE